jgi:hypothetical protein
MVSRFPQPLKPGINYLPFDTVDECVERCAQLLDNPEQAQEMRRRNWEYYTNEIAPARHMLNLIETAFSC